MNYFKHKTALVDKKAKIGKGTRLWAFTNVKAGAVIGRDCNICDGSFVEGGAVVGDNVTIKHHVAVFDGVIIGDGVFVGSNVAFINDRHPRSQKRIGCWKRRSSVREQRSAVTRSLCAGPESGLTRLWERGVS